MKKTVVFDFDGVIHSYTSGWTGVTSIVDEPVDGIREVIQDLRKNYKVVVVSTRCATFEGRETISKWLEKYDIIVDDIVREKPPAIVYVDDRAICFDGNTDTLVEKINNFKNWLGK